MKLLANFFLLALLFTLLMLPLTVMDVATYANVQYQQVLSAQQTTSDYVHSQELTSGNAVEESSSALDVTKYEYYQMPSLYLGVPEGVE